MRYWRTPRRRKSAAPPTDCGKSLDTAGALLGPLAAIGLMSVLAGNVRAVFWVAVLPAVVAVLVLVFGVDEPSRHAEQRPRLRCRAGAMSHALGTPFWIVVVIGAVFTLARFSEAFLVVRAYDLGSR